MATKHKVIPMTFDHTEFAMAMDAMMLVNGITNEELAEMVGLDHSTIENYRNDRSRGWFPRMGTFLDICNVLDLNPVNYFAFADKV